MIKKIIVGSLLLGLLGLGIFYAIDYKLLTDNQISELTNTIAVQDETLNEHILTIEELREQKIIVEEERDVALENLASKTNEYNSLSAIRNQLLLDIDDITSQKNSALAQIELLNNSISSLNEEITELESELADVVLSNSQNQSLILSLQADLSTLQGLKTNLENALLQAQNQNSGLDLQIQALNSDITILNGQIVDLNGQINSLNLTVSSLESQVSDLQNQLENQEDETDYETMQELFNIMLTVPKIDVDINEIEMSVDYAYFTYYADYSQIVNTDYVYPGSLLAEIYYISSDFEIFATSTYSMNDGFNCDPQGSSTDFLAIDYASFNGYIVVVYKDASPDRTIYCYSQFNMIINYNDYINVDKGFNELVLNFGQGDYWQIQVIGEDINYSIQIANDIDMHLTPDMLGLENYSVFNYSNITFKVQCFYENGIACTTLYEV